MDDEQGEKDGCVAFKYLACKSVMFGTWCLCTAPPPQKILLNLSLIHCNDCSKCNIL